MERRKGRREEQGWRGEREIRAKGQQKERGSYQESDGKVFIATEWHGGSRQGDGSGRGQLM